MFSRSVWYTGTDEPETQVWDPLLHTLTIELTELKGLITDHSSTVMQGLDHIRELLKR